MESTAGFSWWLIYRSLFAIEAMVDHPLWNFNPSTMHIDIKERDAFRKSLAEMDPY